MTDSGRRLECACGSTGAKLIERRIGPGRYFAVVRARDGAAGSYALRRLARAVTHSRMLVDGGRSTTVAPGGAVTLDLTVTPAVSGRAALVIERFDPLAGWLFDARLHPRLSGGSATVSFRPPTVGRWRVTGAFDGTRHASPSNGGTATFTVNEPVTDD
jgi:hypothetical protein